MKSKNYKTIGRFYKTRRADLLSGEIIIEDLNNLKLDVICIIKTREQKRNSREPDLVILMKQDNTKNLEIKDDTFL